MEFVRARKGVGKSALLNYAAYKLESKNPKSIYISVKAADLISIKAHPSYDSSALEFTNYWQECLCTRIAIELGRNIHVATTDDAMMLVEMSELLGYKGRNIVSALCDRFNQAIPQLVAEKKCAENSAELLKRYSQKTSISVWLFIDDDSFDNGESFIRFEDIPDLLIKSNYNPDDIWAIHPSYRTVLHLS